MCIVGDPSSVQGSRASERCPSKGARGEVKYPSLCGWTFARNEEANVQKSLSSIKYCQDTWFGRTFLGLDACLSYAEGWEGTGLGEEGDERSTGLDGASSHGISNTVTGNIEFDPAHMVCYAGRAGKARGGCEKAGEGHKIRICRFQMWGSCVYEGGALVARPAECGWLAHAVAESTLMA